jgi:hypothetical protein
MCEFTVRNATKLFMYKLNLIPTILYSRLFDCDSFISNKKKIMSLSFVIVTQFEIIHVRFFLNPVIGWV